MATAVEHFGSLDILINNAGGGFGKSGGHLFQRSAEDITTLISTNLTGSLLCCKAFAPKMAEQGHGKIISIASIAGLVGRDRRMYDRNSMSSQPIDYAAAKAGVIGMTLDLAGLLSPMGIQVNAISPGAFATDMLGAALKTWGEEAVTRQIPMRRFGAPDDIEAAIRYLVSPGGSYVTGAILPVDGGLALV